MASPSRKQWRRSLPDLVYTPIEVTSGNTMLSQINLQADTMLEYSEIVGKLDEIVFLATLRTVVHDKFTASQIENRKLANEPKTAYFCISASFVAQRACHTAQASALLLRHGFADQAFELWRTLFNLNVLIEHLCSEDKEASAERYLSGAASEMMFLDNEAKELSMGYARLVTDSLQGEVDDLRHRMIEAFDQAIVKKDGWLAPDSKHDLKSLAQDAGVIGWYPLYQLAGKLQHGSPISTFIRGTTKPGEIWDPLGHSTDGIPLQCFLTAHVLHNVVSAFCDSTDEISICEDDRWLERSENLLTELSDLLLADAARKDSSGFQNDGGQAPGTDDPKARKQIYEDGGVERSLS